MSAAGRRKARRHNPRGIGEDSEIDLGSAVQGVIEREGDDKWRLDERNRGQQAGVGYAERLVRTGDPVHESQVDCSRGNFGDRRPRVDRADCHQQRRSRRPELAQCRGQKPRSSKRADGDDHLGRLLIQLGDLAAGDVDPKQDSSSVLEETLADGCGANRTPLQEAVTELDLQGCHLLGDR